jgi:glycosyltransferase involved in cell wall biosynthesis
MTGHRAGAGAVVRLTLVVPCFNEQEVLARFHRAVSEEARATGLEYELLFVDDGSRDGSLEYLRKLADEDERVRFLSFSRNFGKESAMLAGLRHAGGDAVILMDADLQHPPELIGRMLELHRQGFDQVVARRTREGDRMGRTLLARAYYWLVNKSVEVELVDGVGDFRLLSRRAVDAVVSLGEYNRFSKGLFAWIGFDTFVFRYENTRRAQGRSTWTFRKLLNYGMDGVISFNNRPLRLSIHLGLLLTTVAVGYAAWVVSAALARGVDVPGYVTLIVAVTVLGGLQMIMLGVIGEYIGRIYYETKRRPHYLVKETNLRPGGHVAEPQEIRGGPEAPPPQGPASGSAVR